MEFMKKKIVFILLLLIGLLFVVDPFNWWPIDHLINKVCTPEDMRPVCTGKINFFNKP
jgi:hypothetical protein